MAKLEKVLMPMLGLVVVSSVTILGGLWLASMLTDLLGWVLGVVIGVGIGAMVGLKLMKYVGL